MPNIDLIPYHIFGQGGINLPSPGACLQHMLQISSAIFPILMFSVLFS